MRGQWTRGWTAAAVLCGIAAAASAQERPVYKCPGNLYTDTLSAKEAATGRRDGPLWITVTGAPSSALQPRAAASLALSVSV